MNKTILITGAGSGIGRDAAIALAKKGHNVIAAAYKEEEVSELNELAKLQNLPLKSFKLDITIEEDRKKIEDFELDVLINCAGIGESGSLAEIPMEKIRLNFETNVFGTLALTQIALKKMIAEDSGRIIIVSSLGGRTPQAFIGSYCMTKFSLSAAAYILRKEILRISKNIHVSVVEPGPYHTGFNQKMLATKYTWMNSSSYFYKLIDELKKEEDKEYKSLEKKSTKTIVNKIVRATESGNPKFRFVAPWIYGAAVQVQRIFGR